MVPQFSGNKKDKDMFKLYRKARIYALGTKHLSNKRAMSRASVDCNVTKQF